MTENPGEPDRPFHDPEPSLGGPDVAAAVDNAESGSEAEGTHRPAPPGEEGESRLEQMREVDEQGGQHVAIDADDHLAVIGRDDPAAVVVRQQHAGPFSGDMAGPPARGDPSSAATHRHNAAERDAGAERHLLAVPAPVSTWCPLP